MSGAFPPRPVPSAGVASGPPTGERGSRALPAPQRWPAWTAPVALIGALVASAIGAVIIDGLVAGVSGSSLAKPPLGAVVGATVFQDVCLIGAALALAYSTTGRVTPAQLGLRPVGLRRGVGWAALGLAAFFVFNAAWTLALGLHQTENLHKQLGLGHDLPGVLAAAAMVSIVAPVAEEVFFRGYFFGALSNWCGPVVAAVITGVVFGALHWLGQTPVAFLVPLAFLGTLLCFIYRRTGSLLPGIALHVLNNALAFGVDEHWGWQIPVLMVVALGVVAAAVGPLMRVGAIRGPAVPA